VSSVAFDEGQSVLASASGNSVFLWDIKSMQLIARNDCLFKVDALRISDWKVYVSHEDGTSFVWDISTSVANLETLSRNSVLHSGRRLNQRGFVESIEPEELRAFWLQSIRDGIR
jgi:WD40 repeat protein